MWEWLSINIRMSDLLAVLLLQASIGVISPRAAYLLTLLFGLFVLIWAIVTV